MATSSFLEQKRASPASFGMVVALHAGVIAAVVLIKPSFVRNMTDPLVADLIKLDPPPPPEPLPPPPEPKVQPANQPPLDMPRQIIETPSPNPTPAQPQQPPAPANPFLGQPNTPPGGTGPTQIAEYIPPRVPDHVPVRTEALFDPRFAGDQQPPYPVSEERAEHEGMVRLRVTVAPSGRVTAAERLSATSEAFWAATQRQALARWRFRPATVDGRPVESTKVLTVHFRLDER